LRELPSAGYVRPFEDQDPAGTVEHNGADTRSEVAFRLAH
jgi:hypothetical protein